MRILAATIAGTALLAVSFVLLLVANEPTDAAAIAGGTGVVVAGALFGLTLLAWRWRAAPRAYVTTSVDTAGFYDDLASALDESTEGYDGSQSLRAAN
jgi:protein-S-isoprenylcysteine O-methyltransferase Ste14